MFILIASGVSSVVASPLSPIPGIQCVESFPSSRDVSSCGALQNPVEEAQKFRQMFYEMKEQYESFKRAADINAYLWAKALAQERYERIMDNLRGQITIALLRLENQQLKRRLN